MNLNKPFLLRLTLISAMGGLLFGYDWVVIAGAKPFYEYYFGITQSANLQGFAMSSALIGCLVGALISGWLSENLGRKTPLQIAALLFSISALGTGIVNEFNLFILFRLLGGLGIGLASVISPMYIAEISPGQMRGKLVSVNQLTIVIGILAAQVVNFLIADHANQHINSDSWNVLWGWRWMFWAELVPAIMFFILAFFIPESPRYLIKHGKYQASLKILEKIGGSEYAKEEAKNIQETLKTALDRIDWGELFNKKIRRILGLGIVIAVFQQWSGINVIFNYAEEIFTSAGYTVSDMLFNVIITGSVNLIFTLISMRIVDTWGRRKLMILGSSGLAVIYLLLGTAFYLGYHGIAILILVMAVIAFYALTLAPITWVVLSEIFPNRVRGAAMAMATSALWVASFILTYTFPILNRTLDTSGTFWLYSGICILGFLFIYFRLPETKGKTLEELEQKLAG